MYRVMIVDDETIVRTSLATIVDWEQEGFQLIGDAVNGKAALKLIDEHPVDVVMTDIKMPVMGGLELIEQLNQLETPPLIIVLSAYSDFAVARQAFKLGAVDYILKSDISAQVVQDCIRNMRQKLSLRTVRAEDHPVQPEISFRTKFHQALLGQQEFSRSFYHEAYTVACFEIENFLEVVSRFGEDLAHSLVQPLLSFAEQIPRVLSRCLLTELSPSVYILLYREGTERSGEVQFVCTQIQNVWRNYMNITATCGISVQTTQPEAFTLLMQEAMRNCTAKYIFGIAGVYDSDTRRLFDVSQVEQRAAKYQKLTEQMKQANHELLAVMCQNTLECWRELSVKEVKQECLYLVYQIAILLADCNDSLWSTFQTDVDFYQKIMRLDTVRELEMWSTNFIRWVSKYLEEKFGSQPADVMGKVEKFIHQHYAEQGLSMKSIAEYVGFNEKYLSTRFNREMGMSFHNYLTDIRMQMAKKIMSTTNMKSYEVGEAVGYSNPEHFARVFKKHTGVTPGSYRK